MPIETLRARARLLMWLVTLPFACLLLLALALIGSALAQGGGQLHVIAVFLPMFVYIGAIWMVRQALKSIARGAMFDQVVPALLGRVGFALFFGALYNVFGVPLIVALIRQRPGMPFLFDGAAVTLGVVGATLVLLAQLLRQASAMRDELDGFF